MNETLFAPTPLFQLNLMLFLSWPAPPSFVEPIFWREGFELRSIAPSIGVPLEALARAQTANLPIQPTASPELVLEQNSQQQLLLIECKSSSFSPASSTSQQSRALLACTGPYLQDLRSQNLFTAENAEGAEKIQEISACSACSAVKPTL